MTAVRRQRAPLTVAAALALSALLAGCASGSPPSPPTGVDGLVVPTPDPDPDDFVDVVDSRWLPLEPGARWEYEVTGDASVRSVHVLARRGQVHDEIATTLVRTVTRDTDGRVVGSTDDHVAQDRDGNVWWFGRDGRWFAEPGLLMPAEPRTGDGFLMAELPTGPVHAQVDEVDGAAAVPAGRYDGLVELAVSGAALAESRAYLAAGTGLVRVAIGDGTSEWGLVAHDEPPS